MKIESSNITFQSSHSLLEVTSVKENLQFWAGAPPGDTLDISEKGRELLKSMGSNESACIEDEEDIPSNKEEQKLKLLEIMLERLLGRKVKFMRPIKLKTDKALANAAPRAGWGLIYDYQREHYESEKVSFSTTGLAKTSDGREIKIELQLSMSREFYESHGINIRAGDALKDPLVINFDAPTAGLTDSKFSFDIDCDGQPDQISQLAAGSGFLSLDLNGDGIINDSSELFGPKSGDGFADLAGYDMDGNGWIDENDNIFDKLRIWTKDEHGNDVLFALGQKGIGAIYLGNAATPFHLKGAGNSSNGVIQKTGIFLKENGQAGTIQHVDLVV